MDTDRKNILVASLWMIGLTLALFFLPLINGLVGGLVGGYKAGDWKRALGAAILPAAVVALGLWIIMALLNAPVWGVLAGAAVGIAVLLADVGLLVGAVIGGGVKQGTSGRRAVRV